MSDTSRKERRRAHRLTRRVIAFLRKNEDRWEIRLEPIFGNAKICRRYDISTDCIGSLLEDGGRIILADPREDVLGTVIHEVFHALFPDLPEKGIQDLEELCMRNLTRKQAESIMLYTVLLTGALDTLRG